MSFKISPLAPKKSNKFQIIDGVKVSIAHCGLKKNNKEDLVLIKFDRPSIIFGAYTKSKTPGHPIIWNKSISKFGKVSAILINSGNANVFTGREGEKSIKLIIEKLSNNLKIKKNEIYLASTGIIGEKLDYKKIIKKIPGLIKDLDNSDSSWLRAANAIRTTDTYPKIECKKSILNEPLIINSIAKGSGMIAPNMATMLAFIFTNAEKPKDFRKKFFLELIDKSFNSITVDSDTSTSDMVLLIFVKNNHFELNIDSNKKKLDFLNILEKLMIKLSHLIVKDGEGASKFLSIEVVGAKTKSDAKIVAFSIANSPLFKTALAGTSFNWGRIVMAIGKSGIFVNPDEISIKVGNYEIFKKGESVNKNQSKISRYLKKKEIEIKIDLGVSKENSKVWTCDFTKDYIKINADYRS